MTDLTGEVALVTGSGRGLGFSIARALVARGARVAIHDRDTSACAEFGEFADLDAARRAAGAAVAVTGDIADPDAVKALVAQTQAALGPITRLVCCAGGDIAAAGGKPKPNDALGVKIEDIRALIDRNLMGTILACQAICPGMAERGNGAVVNIASTAAHQGVSDGVIYAVAKAGVAQYTRCLAAQLRPAGVRVNAISPGPTKTARFQATRPLDPEQMDESNALDRYGTPAELADAVAYLLSSESRFISGQILRVDGGLSLYAA